VYTKRLNLGSRGRRQRARVGRNRLQNENDSRNIWPKMKKKVKRSIISSEFSGPMRHSQQG
jgi:hypothetical protein